MRYEKTIYAFIFIILISIDQLIKYLIRHYDGFYICNKGIAFGLNLPLTAYLLIFIFLFCILFINYKHQIPKDKQASNPKRQTKKKFFGFEICNLFGICNLGFVILLSGAISNMLDRLYSGCVIDFIDTKIWPVFNLADVYITLGAIMLVWKLLKTKQT